MRIELWPVKGGVGTSTIAATLAANLIEPGQTSNIICKTRHEVRDLLNIFATANYSEDIYNHAYKPHLIRELEGDKTVSLTYTEFAHVYNDGQTKADVNIVVRPLGHSETPVFWPGAYNILLTERSYLGLSAAISYDKVNFNMAVVYTRDTDTLTSKDVSAVLRVPEMIEWKHDAAVSRSIDAGLYINRYHRLNYKSDKELVNHIKTERNQYV